MNKVLAALACCFMLVLGFVFYAEYTGQLEQFAASAAVMPAEKVPVPAVTPQPSPTFKPTAQSDPLMRAIDDNYVSNEELQIYFKDQTLIDGDTIRVTAEPVGNRYISGKAISTQGFKYCTLTFRAEVMHGDGLFPALWLLPLDQSTLLPEIDIYEQIGNQPELLYGVIHYMNGMNQERDFFTHRVEEDPLPESYIIQFEWRKDHLAWYMDGELLYRIEENVPQIPMYLIANLAIGGEWAGPPMTQACFLPPQNLKF